MTINEINQSIMFGKFDNDQLNSIIMAVKFARAQIIKKNCRSFVVGDAVKFVSSRTGNTITGTVQKILIKNITVKTNVGLYRVPANMLEAA
jgi:hypothetical protein